MNLDTYTAVTRRIGLLAFGVWAILLLGSPISGLLGIEFTSSTIVIVEGVLRTAFGVGVAAFALYVGGKVLEGYREDR